jgi:SPP1 gp7 family putative phage head morphogenesis protein
MVVPARTDPLNQGPNLTGEVDKVARRYRNNLDSLDEDAIKSQIYVYNDVLARLDAEMNAVAEMIDDAEMMGKPVPVSWLHRQERYQSLALQTKREFEHYAKYTGDSLDYYGTRAVSMGQASGIALLEASLPNSESVLGGFRRLPDGALKQLAGTIRRSDSPVGRILDRLPRDAASSLDFGIINGTALGQHPNQIVDGIKKQLAVIPTRTATIVRTEMYRAFRESNRAVWRENDETVDGWQWNAYVGAYTCAACLAMHGSLHELTEPMGSHPNCRCTMVPRTKSWTDLGFPELDKEFGDRRAQFPDPEQWMSNLPDDRQNRMLGIRKAQLYRNGELKLVDMIHRSDSYDWGTTRRVASVKHSIRNASFRQQYEQRARDEAARLSVKATEAKAARKAAAKVGREPAWLQKIRKKIDAGITTEQDAVALGGMVKKQVLKDLEKLPETPQMKVVETLKREVREQEARIARRMDEIDPSGALRKNDPYGLDYSTFGSDDALRELKRDLRGLQIRVNQAEREIEGNVFGAALRKRLADIRPMGSAEKQLFSKAPKALKTVHEEAKQGFPEAWVKKMNAQPVELRTVARGYYGKQHAKDGGNLIAISGHDERSIMSTMVHEIGHRLEDYIPEIKELERQFYARRTAGESLVHMGSGYRKDEITRLDKFNSPYMGKDYGGRYYELVSMGFEGLTAPVRPMRDLLSDDDMTDFIIGILAGV